jgi:hypothetical protein
MINDDSRGFSTFIYLGPIWGSMLFPIGGGGCVAFVCVKLKVAAGGEERSEPTCLEPNIQPMQGTYRGGRVTPTYLVPIRISMQKPIGGRCFWWRNSLKTSRNGISPHALRFFF